MIVQVIGDHNWTIIMDPQVRQEYAESAQCFQELKDVLSKSSHAVGDYEDDGFVYSDAQSTYLGFLPLLSFMDNVPKAGAG